MLVLPSRKIWTTDAEANFLAKAPEHLHRPLLLALWTGQRQLGEFYNLHFIVIDSKGNVYSAEVQGKRVQKFRNLGGL